MDVTAAVSNFFGTDTDNLTFREHGLHLTDSKSVIFVTVLWQDDAAIYDQKIQIRGETRACDWTFNAWGGLVDGLYFPWDKDDRIASKICELEQIDSYRTDDFVLEGGSFHVDGEGTLITTEMCLLSKGRNPHLTKAQIEQKLKDYLNVDTIIWIKDGIDPDETNGHIDDVACFIRPGEVACIYTDDPTDPFYKEAQARVSPLSFIRKDGPISLHHASLLLISTIRTPGEFEEQKQIFMIWPERTDNWRAGAKPAQKTFANVAAAKIGRAHV